MYAPMIVDSCSFEVATAFAFSGNLHFDPQKDSIILKDGSKFQFHKPESSEPDCDIKTSSGDVKLFSRQPTGRVQGEVDIDPDSSRLQMLEPFPPWDGSLCIVTILQLHLVSFNKVVCLLNVLIGKDVLGALVLIKVQLLFSI